MLPDLLDRLLDEPYYARPAPKSTGKELFHLAYLLDRLGPTQPAAEDLLATLVALTARTVADAVRHTATEVVASGGGTRNPVLMAALREELPGVAVRTSDELGVPSQAKEALAFAVLGWHTWFGLPGVLPGATGARHPSVLGSVTPGADGRYPPGRATDVGQPVAAGDLPPGLSRLEPADTTGHDHTTPGEETRGARFGRYCGDATE